jgi:hypothetical protein
LNRKEIIKQNWIVYENIGGTMINRTVFWNKKLYKIYDLIKRIIPIFHHALFEIFEWVSVKFNLREENILGVKNGK